MSGMLTTKQKQVLRFIEKFLTEHGYPPTRGEIAGWFGFKSINAAHQHCMALERKGWLVITPNVSRGIVPASFKTAA